MTLSTDQLRHTVETDVGGKATFVHAVAVHEQSGGRTLWDGVVTVFDLKGCPAGAFRAYACSDTGADGQQRCLTVLHTPVIVGPRQAVRAALAEIPAA